MRFSIEACRLNTLHLEIDRNRWQSLHILDLKFVKQGTIVPRMVNVADMGTDPGCMCYTTTLAPIEPKEGTNRSMGMNIKMNDPTRTR